MLYYLNIAQYWCGYRPFTFRWMFEPRHNNIRKYVATLPKHSAWNYQAVIAQILAKLRILQYVSMLQAVCTKCGIDTFNSNHQPLWLCKICSENREVNGKIIRDLPSWSLIEIPWSSWPLGCHMRFASAHVTRDSAPIKSTSEWIFVTLWNFLLLYGFSGRALGWVQIQVQNSWIMTLHIDSLRNSCNSSIYTLCGRI